MSKLSYPPEARHPALIVLQALMMDISITIKDQTFRLMENKDGTKVLCLECTEFIGNVKQPDLHYLESDMTIGDFIAFCEKLPWDDIVTIVANTTLNKMHHDKWKGRELREEAEEETSKPTSESSSAHKAREG